MQFLSTIREHRFFTEEDRDAIGWFYKRYLRPKLPWLLVIFAMTAVQGLVYQQFLRLTEDGLRVVLDSGSVQQLFHVCLMVIGVFAVRGVVSYATPRLSAWIAGNAIKQMRDDMIAHYLTLDLAFFDRSHTGGVIQQLVRQAEGLSRFVGQETVKALRDIATVLVVSAYLTYKQPVLFAATLLLTPIVVLVLHLVSQRIKEIQRNAESAMGAYVGSLEEMTNGIRTIRIAGQEEMEQSRLAASTDNIKNIQIKLTSAKASVLPWIDMAAALAFVMVIGGGGYMVLSPNYSIDGPEIIAFLIGLVLVFDPARRLSSFFVSLQASLIMLKSIRGLFFQTPTIFDKTDPAETFDPTGDIVFRDVNFDYSASQPLFKDLNLTIPGGKTTAIVGPTGSGKTTILSLLGRLYEASSGDITIAGTPIEDIRVKALRRNFSVVAQDIVIFNTSILENIRYVRPEATDEEVWAAAEAAEIKDVMLQRAKAPVGPKGAQLSGGQKQRIAIARAFLRNEPIILLDEATSALDQQTEDRIKGALDRLTGGKTTIIVAHRLSSVANADRIYVLEMGNVVEFGTHTELMQKGGLYASLYSAQKQGYES